MITVNGGWRTADGAEQRSRLAVRAIHFVGRSRKHSRTGSITVRRPPSAIHSAGGRYAS